MSDNNVKKLYAKLAACFVDEALKSGCTPLEALQAATRVVRVSLETIASREKHTLSIEDLLTRINKVYNVVLPEGDTVSGKDIIDGLVVLSNVIEASVNSLRKSIRREDGSVEMAGNQMQAE